MASCVRSLRERMRVGDAYPVDDVRMIKKSRPGQVPDKKYEQPTGQNTSDLIREFSSFRVAPGKDSIKWEAEK